MSAAASFLPRYTPAQLEADRRIKAIRAKQKAVMMGRLLDQLARQRAEEEADRRAAMEAAARHAETRLNLAACMAAARQAAARFSRRKKELSEGRKREVLARVGALYGMSPDDITARSRVMAVVTARVHAIALIAEEAPDISLPGIGRGFGLDHTTVIHSIRRYNEAMGENVRGLGGPRPGRKGAYADLFLRFPEAV
jgi:chromosomal replication initiation ATPase DnaA